MKAKIWIMLAIALCAVAALYMGCSRAEARGKLQVMYSGNLKGAVTPCGCKVPKGGLARRAEFLSRHRDSGANWLTVDAGNFVDKAGGTGGCTSKCQFTIFAYEDLHYDVLNIGRQEVDMGHSTLQAIMDTVRGTKFISANLLDRASGKLFTEPYVIKDYGNMKVAVLGILNDADFKATGAGADSAAFKVTPSADALKKYVPALRRKSDVIVLLCDLPTTALDSILPGYPDVDLVISSAALRTGEQPAKIGHAQVVGTGSSGYNAASCTLELNPSWTDSVGFAYFSDQLSESYDAPGIWTERLAQFQTNPPPAAPAIQSSISSPPSTANPTGRPITTSGVEAQRFGKSASTTNNANSPAGH